MGLPRSAEVETRGEQRQQAHRGHLGDDEREQFLRRRVDPMQVFDDGQHRVLRRHREHRFEQRLQRPLLLAFRAHRRPRIARGRRQRQQRSQQRQALAGRDAVALAELDQLVEARRVGIAATPAEHAPEQRDHRIQRAVGAVFRAAQLEQHVRPVRDVRHHRLHEARLADPGIPHDQDHASLPLDHLVPAVVQEPELLVATDQRRGSDARRWGTACRRVRAKRGERVCHRCRARDLPDLHRRHEALDREHPEVLVREAIAGQAPRAVPDHDPVRRGQGLQACGEIRCLAERDPLAYRTRLGQVADDHEAGRHADAHAQRPADPIEFTDLGDEREPGANGAHGVVFVPVGVAEIDHGTVAEQQRDVAIEVPHGIGDALMVPADDLAEVFRVELRRQLGGTHQVAEEDGELPSLGALCRRFARRSGRAGRDRRRDATLRAGVARWPARLGARRSFDVPFRFDHRVSPAGSRGNVNAMRIAAEFRYGDCANAVSNSPQAWRRCFPTRLAASPDGAVHRDRLEYFTPWSRRPGKHRMHLIRESHTRHPGTPIPTRACPCAPFRADCSSRSRLQRQPARSTVRRSPS